MSQPKTLCDFHLKETSETFSGSTKMEIEIFTGKRLTSRRENIEKSDFTLGKNRKKVPSHLPEKIRPCPFVSLNPKSNVCKFCTERIVHLRDSGS